MGRVRWESEKKIKKIKDGKKKKTYRKIIAAQPFNSNARGKVNRRLLESILQAMRCYLITFIKIYVVYIYIIYMYTRARGYFVYTGGLLASLASVKHMNFIRIYSFESFARR